jgi:mRNA interferase MazF
VKRGEIWWAGLPDESGSGSAGRRPALVISSDGYNQSTIQTVVVAVVTSNTKAANFPGNVWVSSDESGLPIDSVVNVTQLFTLDKRDLTERVGELAPESLDLVDHGLRTILQL